MNARRLTWPALLLACAAFWTLAVLHPLPVLAALVVLASLRTVRAT